MRSTPIRRLIAVGAIAFALPVGVGAIAVAQEPTQTDTTTLGDYTQTLPPGTSQTTDTQETLPEQETGTVDQDTTETTPAPPPAPPTSGATPDTLAFTGFEALAVGAIGLALMGAALVLQRRRRRI